MLQEEVLSIHVDRYKIKVRPKKIWLDCVIPTWHKCEVREFGNDVWYRLMEENDIMCCPHKMGQLQVSDDDDEFLLYPRYSRNPRMEYSKKNLWTLQTDRR